MARPCRSLAREEARFRAAGKGPWVAEASGFNVHAGVLVRAGDREGLERLCRYGARPPFSLERLRDPCRRPRGVPPPQAEAQRRDASRDDAGAIFGEDRGADSAASVPITALVVRVRAALAASCGRGSARAGESRGDADVAAREGRSGRRRSPMPRRHSWRAARRRRPSASAATARTPCGAARGRASGTAS